VNLAALERLGVSATPDGRTRAQAAAAWLEGVL
jgi:hypothetical protein